ncbi:MAG: hypothetical protein Kow00124_07580 [Anaerolineae bacterium]
MNRRLIALVGVVAFAVTLGIVAGSRLTGTTALAILLGVAIGVVVGVAIGLAVALHTLRRSTIPVDELYNYLDALYAGGGVTLPPQPGDARTTPSRSGGALTTRRTRQFTAVGWTTPPEGFDEDAP